MTFSLLSEWRVHLSCQAHTTIMNEVDTNFTRRIIFIVTPELQEMPVRLYPQEADTHAKDPE